MIPARLAYNPILVHFPHMQSYNFIQQYYIIYCVYDLDYTVHIISTMLYRKYHDYCVHSLDSFVQKYHTSHQGIYCMSTFRT